MDATVNGVAKAVGRRNFRMRRLANPEKKADYGEALACAVESFFSVTSHVIVKGFAIQLGGEPPVRKMTLPGNEKLKITMPWFTKGDLAKIRYMEVPAVKKTLVGRRARTQEVADIVHRISRKRKVQNIDRFYFIYFLILQKQLLHQLLLQLLRATYRY